MSGILNVGTRALMANQIALQTAGNNIANVNTVGYSRQSAVMQTVPGQFSGAGYIGKGVEVATIERTYSEFLTRQAAIAGATSSGDTARADKMRQLETLFQGGTSGLGAAVSDMLNAFSDVASAPTDLTARTVALTRISETALRMSNTSTSMDDLQQNLTIELKNKVNSINSLASGIASVNEKIARAQGNGQPPNDLLDQRDQLVRELNQYTQTSSIPASDGTVGIFIGGSQALVLGNTAAAISLTADDFGVQNSMLSLTRNGQTVALNEATLGGGEVPGLLRFQNTDMAEARNLLGRYTLAVTTSMNEQHKLGLDLDGNVGGNLFTPVDIGAAGNILAPKAPATLNTGNATLGLTISDVTKFAASDYEVIFTSAATGNITRRSDGVITAFGAVPITIDGMTLGVTAGAANAGDRFLLRPFNASASNISAEFSSPRALAVASPVAGKMGANNTGSLQLTALTARTNPPANVPVTLTFTGVPSSNSYTRSDVAGTFSYTSGQAIEGSVPATSPLSQWSITLQGMPKPGDTFQVEAQPAAFRNLNSGNASAMMNLRDVAMFDGAVMTDGYASLISQVGIRTQSANYAAEVSSAIADGLERGRTGVAGVNLDEEAAKLLQYQQAYQASAKVIQIAQGIFDTLIQTVSR
jgi:flagellar hook-associated protein 1 FlgK